MDQHRAYQLTDEIRQPSRALALARAVAVGMFRFLRVLRSELSRIPDYHDEAARRAEALRKLHCDPTDPPSPRFGETTARMARK